LKNKKKKIVAFALVICFTISAVSNANGMCGNAELIAELTLRVPGGSIIADYGLYIVRDLRDLGVEVQVQMQEWLQFVGQVLYTHDYDMFILSGSGPPSNIELAHVYEPPYTSPYNLDLSIPYFQEAECLLNESKYEMDFIKRKTYLDQWQDLVMDKILYQLPLFSRNSHTVTWSNLKGLNSSWSIEKNLPNLAWDGLHEGQNNTETLRIEGSFRNLNPLQRDDLSSEKVNELLMMPILEIDSNNKPIPTSIIKDWTRIDNTTFKFTIRDEIYWAPSYNIIGRNEHSNELNPKDTSQLMTGVRGGYSNGQNKKVTAKDVIFTLLAWSNSLTSKATSLVR